MGALRVRRPYHRPRPTFEAFTVRMSWRPPRSMFADRIILRSQPGERPQLKVQLYWLRDDPSSLSIIAREVPSVRRKGRTVLSARIDWAMFQNRVVVNR